MVTVTDGAVDRAVGLYWASGGDSDGDPLMHGVMTPAGVVESQLNVRF